MRKPDCLKRAVLAALLCALALAFSSCSQDLSGAYQKAINTFATGDYEAAARAFGGLGGYAQAPTYAAYSRGMVFFEQGAYTEAEPYFENTVGFMYGAARYAYCHAYALEEAVAYAEASEAFLALSGFEDAETHGRYCAARAAETAGDNETALYEYGLAGMYSDSLLRLRNIQMRVYYDALTYRRARQYEKALNLFIQLGDYEDSAEQAGICKKFFREQSYAEAEALEAQGQLREAYDRFQALSGFSNAESRAEALAARLGIPADGEEE